MTTIGLIQYRGHVALVSDIVGTSLRGTEVPFIPTLGEAHADAPDRRPIVALCQKTAVIRDNLAISFSGNGDAAWAICGELYASLPVLPTLEDFDAAINRVPYAVLSAATYIGALLTEAGPVPVHTPLVERRHADELMYMTAGSGASELAHMLATRAPALMARPGEDADKVRDLAFSSAVTLQAMQVIGRSGLKEGWGGGFETTIVRDGKFEKLGDVSVNYLVFWMHPDAMVQVQLYEPATLLTYNGRVAEFIRSERGGGPSKCFTIPPMCWSPEQGIVLRSPDAPLPVPRLKAYAAGIIGEDRNMKFGTLIARPPNFLPLTDVEKPTGMAGWLHCEFLLRLFLGEGYTISTVTVPDELLYFLEDKNRCQ